MDHPNGTEEVSVCLYFSIKFLFRYCEFLFQELESTANEVFNSLSLCLDEERSLSVLTSSVPHEED